MNRIQQFQRVRIVTSGYSDRWLDSTKTIEITIDDPVTTGYVINFDRPEYAIRYVERTQPMAWDDAYKLVNDSPVIRSLPWRHRDVRSSISSTPNIEQFLKIIDDSIRDDIRIELAENIELSQNEYHAICTGLYECNLSNLLTHRGIKNIVLPDGFLLNSDYDPERIRKTLRAIAIDPTICYFDNTDDIELAIYDYD